MNKMKCAFQPKMDYLMQKPTYPNKDKLAFSVLSNINNLL